MKDERDQDHSWHCLACTTDNGGKYATWNTCHMCSTVRPREQAKTLKAKQAVDMSERPRKQAKQAVNSFLEEDRKPTWDEKKSIEERERQAVQAVDSSYSDEAQISLQLSSQCKRTTLTSTKLMITALAPTTLTPTMSKPTTLDDLDRKHKCKSLDQDRNADGDSSTAGVSLDFGLEASIKEITRQISNNLNRSTSEIPNISKLLDRCFALAGKVKEEEVYQRLCDQLNLDTNVAGLNRFTSIIMSKGHINNPNFTLLAYKVLSRVNMTKCNEWMQQAVVDSAMSRETNTRFNERQKSHANETLYESSRALIFDRASRPQVNTTVETNTTVDNDEMEIDSSPPSDLAYFLCTHLYMKGFLYSDQDLKHVLDPTVCLIGSFSVNLSFGDDIISRDAHEKGWGWGPAMSIEFMNSMKHSLESRGERVVSFDLILEAFKYDALDNIWPSGVRQEMNAFASNLIKKITLSKSDIRIIALGRPVCDSLESANEKFGSNVTVLGLPHPCNMSAYRFDNVTLFKVASIFDNFLRDENVSIRGLVIMRGLRPDKQGQVGGSLGMIILRRSVEINDFSDGTPDSNPHIDVVTYCESQGIHDDSMAARELIKTDRGHLPLPLSRTAYYLSQHGRCGGDNDHRVLRAKAVRDKLLECPVRDNIAIQAAEEELREAIAARDLTREGKRKAGACGGNNDYRVDEAQENVANLLKATVKDPIAIKVAEEKLKLAIAARDSTSKAKSKAGACGGDKDYRVDEAQENVANLLKATVQDPIANKVAEDALKLAIAARDSTSKAKSKAGACGGDEDYRVDEAQANRKNLLKATVQDPIAIQAAEDALKLANAARDSTSKAKSRGGSKGGSCGTDKDHRVAEAKEERKKLLEAPEQDPAAIKIADEKLEFALAKKEETRKGKGDGGKFMYSLETKIFITNNVLLRQAWHQLEFQGQEK